MLKEYLSQISKTLAHGDAREESFYGDLKNFLKEFAIAEGKKKIDITVLPKKTEAGNPDFRVWDGMQHIVGYIEAKAPDSNLDTFEESTQLKRYRGTFPNLILTNFYEFRLYRNGELVDKVQIARSFISKKLKTVPPVENEEKFLALLGKFFTFSLPKVFTAEQLATELAKRTRFLRDEVITIEMEQEQKGKGALYGFFDAFKKYLIANLNEKDFADLFSQTITYGLFAARTRSTNGFNRKLAYDFIPKTIGILRNVFKFISQGDLPKPMEVIIDDIAEVLHVADVNNILHQYFTAGKGEDPIVHFYETFLNIYDPATREKRGVYYTPEPVVRYIVRSVHELLKTHFDLDDGLASKEVTLLDPAGGTLTFPAEAIKLAVHEFTDKYGQGGKSGFIRDHILKNFYSFELMMAPYAIGHIKISFLLDELGYKMKDDERFKLYLTNTLDMEDLSQTQIPGLESLSEESHSANEIKKKEKILVIIGNPPYSIEAGTLTKEARQLVEKYKFVNGIRIKEKGALQFEKTLQDDYVKFIAFAQRKIEHTGYGIIGYITNHNFLDGPMLRGMRNSLINSFDEIYTIDLHGSNKKKEKTPSGSKDQNVFDIQQGVSISFFIKLPNSSKKKVLRTDVYGLRTEKYDWLERHSLKNSKFTVLEPQSPNFYFKEFDIEGSTIYDSYFSIKEIFPNSGAGIITAHDKFVIDDDATALETKFDQFKRSKVDEELLHELFQVGKKKGWSIIESRTKLKSYTDQDIKNRVVPLNYRPFYKRQIFYDEAVVWSASYPTMQHMLKSNLALAIGRQGQVVGADHNWNLALITDCIIDFNLFYRGGELLFPLYLYQTEDRKKKTHVQGMMLFEPETKYDSKNRIPNISPEVFDQLEKAFKKKPTPEQILYYCYGVLYSNIYREKYAEFLKIDFPRIPFTKDFKIFSEMAELGEQLAELHLLKSKLLSKPIAKFEGGANDVIEKPSHDEENRLVFINNTKYFEGISTEVWNYHIGGYQVMEKYLKDRRGRQMTDPATYCKIATAIHHTIKIQKQLDGLYNKGEKDVIS